MKIKSNLEKAKTLFALQQISYPGKALVNHHNVAVRLWPVTEQELPDLIHFEFEYLFSQVAAGAQQEVLDRYLISAGEKLKERDYMAVVVLLESSLDLGSEPTLWDDHAEDLAQYIETMSTLIEKKNGLKFAASI